jgi:lysophospholipase L1-like esterase
MEPMSITLGTQEADDPYCLRLGEAAALLAGHPWRRFAAIGDSIAEGIGEASPGYPDQPWIDRIAAELQDAAERGAAVGRAALGDAAPKETVFEYRNFGYRDTRTAQVRATQLEPACAFAPDLVMVACGGADALSRSYDADTVEVQLRAIVARFLEIGAEVITVSMFDGSYSPVVPEQLREGLRVRLHDLSARSRRIAEDLGTIHVDFTDHPATPDRDMYSADGRHGTRRAHAIAAAGTVRRLGERLGNVASGDAAEAGQAGEAANGSAGGAVVEGAARFSVDGAAR